MKHFIIILLLIFMTESFAIAEMSKSQEVWGENTSVLNSGFEGQKPVTDNKFKQTVKMMKERALTKKQKKLRDKITPLSPSADFEHLKEFTENESAESELSQAQTVMIPLSAYNEDGIRVSPGYYKISCRKLAKDEYVLDLSQGTKRVLSVKARQTSMDLEQDAISFCNAEIIDNSRIRLVYGNIDLNLVGYLYFD